MPPEHVPDPVLLTVLSCPFYGVTPLWSLRRVMQFDTLRLRLIKLAARVSEGKAQITIHLPSSAPDQAIFALLLERLPCLGT